MFRGSASQVWLKTLAEIMRNGIYVEPRGKPTLELQHHTVHVKMSNPVVQCRERKLSYVFMAAEALWILSGDNRVETIAPYNSNIAKFSDDGQTFFGAYGPRIASQFDYVVRKLAEDTETRQAFMTIWRETPPATKDVPCTVAIGFGIRKGKLHAYVFMRSSDAWLGLPYDVFNFSMLAVKVACAFNERGGRSPIDVGWLHLTMASSHLYRVNIEGAERCIAAWNPIDGAELPPAALFTGDWLYYVAAMTACRDKMEHEWRIRP